MTVKPSRVRRGIRLFAGYQAVSLYEAYRRFGLRGDPDLPSRARRELCDLLRVLGYRERFLSELGGDGGGLMWIRDPWPIDYAVLDFERGVQSFVRF